MDSLISVQSMIANLTSKSIAVKKIVDQYDEKLSSLPDKMLEYTRLERNRSIYAETYKFMKQKA